MDGWAKDVTGDGSPLNMFCREILVDSLLYGHSSVLVDYANGDQPANLAEEIALGRKPYLVRVGAQQVRGWRTVDDRNQAPLTMVRYSETISQPVGQFGEELITQIRVLTDTGYQIWRDEDPNNSNSGWSLYEEGDHTAGEVPMTTVYSNRIATLVSKPPLEECANLRSHTPLHRLHAHSSVPCPSSCPGLIGSEQPGLSVNTAVLLP